MADLIRRSTLNHLEWESVIDAVKAVETAPAVDAVEVKHGRWEKGEYPGEYTCSHCGMEYCEANPEENPFKYCPKADAPKLAFTGMTMIFVVVEKGTKNETYRCHKYLQRHRLVHGRKCIFE